jgi:hypothetical protein
MAAILAQMSPEAAERLTVELAVRSGSDRGLNPSSLPKIEGRPAAEATAIYAELPRQNPKAGRLLFWLG